MCYIFNIIMYSHECPSFVNVTLSNYQL